MLAFKVAYNVYKVSLYTPLGLCKPKMSVAKYQCFIINTVSMEPYGSMTSTCVFIINSVCSRQMQCCILYHRNAFLHFILSTHVSACTVVLQNDEGSEDEVDNTLTEEKHVSDLDNESERLSGEEELTDEEGSPGTEAAAGNAEQSTETSVRKRKPQGPISPEAT